MSAQTEIRIGSEFVGYRIDELIGRGGMGVVYRAYDLRLKRTVALKLMAPELALDQRFRERFAREAELAMSLEHPNVVPIHDAGDIDGRLYLAMRHVEGTDLRALLRAEGALDPARALAICSQVANALDAAHAKGLVHRDVKPSNVLLDASEHVYLADFGLTRRLDEQGGPAGEGRSVGTPAYLAPEQIEGGPIDGRADVYSLGCLLYECLTGETPFARGSRLAVAWAHLEEEPPSASERRPELPEAIDAVIRKAMAKEPEDRYTTCAALIAAAEEALGLRRPPTVRRHRLLVIAAVATLACSLAAALVAACDRSRHAGGGADAAGHGRTRSSASTQRRTRSARSSPSARVPSATAVGGRSSVWVYNADGPSVSEIDATTERCPATQRHVRRGADRPAAARGAGARRRPAGAWFVGADAAAAGPISRGCSRGFAGSASTASTRQAPASRGRLRRRLGRRSRRPRQPGAAHRPGHRRGHQADALPRLRRRSTGLAVGLGSVWVVASSTATLYRIDPRSARVTGRIDLGSRAPPDPRWCLGCDLGRLADDGR